MRRQIRITACGVCVVALIVGTGLVARKIHAQPPPPPVPAPAGEAQVRALLAAQAAGGGRAAGGPLVPTPPTGSPGMQYGAIRLVEESKYQGFIRAARESIQDGIKGDDKAWDDAVTA